MASRTPSGPRSTDYCLIAIAYAEEAVQDRGRRRHGKWIRLAARRFLKDLKRAAGKRPPFLWSPERANHACRFIELLPHVEGQWDTANLRLVPAQVFFVAQLFGFRNHDGGRRFTEALYSTARKNAKSTLAAAIMLYCLCHDPEPGAQVISAATTGQQAGIVWKIAKLMAQKKPALRHHYRVECFARSIVRYTTGGSCRAINAKASTQDGLNPSFVDLDEVHAHKTHDLLNVLRSASGARRNPLFMYTTTEGYETPGPWPELREFAKRILMGVITAEHFLAVYFACDIHDDDFSEAAVLKANPLWEVSPTLREEVRKLQIAARTMPGSMGEYLTKRLNRQASAADGFVNLRKWKRCAGAVPLERLVGAPCWAGLDLASTRDMCAWFMLWLVDDVYYTWGRYWVPAEAVAQRTERRSVPYAAWAQAGLITMTDGDVADYGVIEREVIEDCQRFAPRAIGYDPWNAMPLVVRLADAMLPVQQFIQGPKSYHPAMQAFERAYASGNLQHGGHRVLQWNAANLVARRDVNMNMAPDKKRSAERIDGVVALIMAFGMSVSHADDGGDAAGFLKNPVRA